MKRVKGYSKVEVGLGFKNFWSAKQTNRGFEANNAICKGQMVGLEKGNIQSQNCSHLRGGVPEYSVDPSCFVSSLIVATESLGALCD